MNNKRSDIPRACLKCGNEFYPLVEALKKGRGLYCSYGCSAGARSDAAKQPNRIRERLQAKLIPQDTGCLFFSGYLDADGYGHMSWARRDKLVHRLAWELQRGTIPESMCVCHSCDALYPAGDISYRRCANVEHLFLGTNEENLSDRDAKERQASGLRHGQRQHPERTARGSRNGSAKLHEAQIPEIRRLLAAGMTQRQVADHFGVSSGAIGTVARGERWNHI